MGRKRKSYASSLKATVALAAVKGDRTVSQLASQYDVHPALVQSWKKQLLANAPSVFASGAATSDVNGEAMQTELYEQIGRLQMELAWLKKKVARFD